MCLYIPKRKSLNRIKRINLSVKTVYKIATLTESGSLIGCFERHYEYSPGIMKTSEPKIVFDLVGKGFHSCTSLKLAVNSASTVLSDVMKTNQLNHAAVLLECSIPSLSRYYTFNGRIVSSHLRIDKVYLSTPVWEKLSTTARQRLQSNYKVEVLERKELEILFDN
jgi:hypothetical protein